MTFSSLRAPGTTCALSVAEVMALMMAMAAAVATRAAEKGLQQLESVCGAWRGGYAVAAVWLAAIETVRRAA